MALVRISKELLDAVRSRINDMRSRELETYPAESVVITNSHPDYDIWLGIIEQVMWEKAPQFRGQLPKDWCMAPRAVDFYYAGAGVDSAHTSVSRIHVRFEPVRGQLLAPPGTSSYPDVYCGTQHNFPHIDAILASMAENVKARAEITDRYTNISNQMVSFLSAQPSLNKALLVLPEVALYIDDKYIARVNEKVTRSTHGRDEPEVQVDVEAITAAAIAHRMALARGA